MASVDEIGGVDRAQCETFLQSTAGVDAVLRTVDMVHSMGVCMTLLLFKLNVIFCFQLLQVYILFPL